MQHQNKGFMTKKRKSGVNSAAVFFVVFFVLAAVIAMFLLLDFSGKEKRDSVEYVIGTLEKYKLEGDKAYAQNGVLLVCFDEIAEMCEMTITGSSEEKNYYAKNSEQRIVITNGSKTAMINNRTQDMRAAAELRNGKMYIPIDFVRENMAGIAVSFEENVLTVKRGEYNSSTKENPKYEDVSFAGGNDEPLTPPEDTVKKAPTYKFVTDLSTFEEYMCPEDIDGYLTLVNREKTVGRSYVPQNLVPITNVRKDGRSESMVETAEKALQALYIEMRAMGYTDVSVTSGYRTYDKQEYLYNLYTENEMKNNGISKAEAQKIVDTYSARPGTSEHQTGLCVDMHNLGSASQKFANEEAYDWLINNCYKFGFILRFPEGKEDITGYSFEPWHYRFVGRYHASRIHELDMCLEEYVLYLEENE